MSRIMPDGALAGWRTLPLPALAPLLVPPLVVLGVMLQAHGRLVLPVTVVCFWALLGLAALRHSHGAVLACAAVLIVVPVYYGRYVVGTVAVTPQAAVCLVLLPLAFSRIRQFRWTLFDGFVLAFVVFRCASLLVNYSSGPGAVVGVLLAVALPYGVFRLCLDDRLVFALQPLVVLVAAGLSLVAIRERMGVPNPFFTMLTPTYQGDFYARPSARLGGVRGEASFGEPISFGMFLSLALVLATHLALSARTGRDRLLAIVSAGLILMGLSATQSRGALLVAVLGVAGYLLVHARRINVLRFGALVGAAVVLALSTNVASSIAGLVATSAGDTRESRSAEYRLQILEVVQDPQQFSLLGQRTEQTTGQASTDLSRRVGLKSIDSQYALLYLDGGVLSLAAFGGIAALVVMTALRGRGTPTERAWAMGLAATFVNLLTVALFTQESDVVWMGIALLAGITQRLHEGERA